MDTYQQLIEAIEQNDIQQVRRLIDEGVDIKQNNNLALRIALNLDHRDILRLLVDQGGIGGTFDYNVFEVPIGRNDLEMVRYLFENGFRDDDALTASVKKFYYMVDKQGKRNFVYRKPDMRILKYLLEQGFDPNETSLSGLALHTAVSNLKVDQVKLLLQYGADPNMLNNHGQTPLMIVAGKTCSIMNHSKYEKYPKAIEIAKILLDAGADPNVRSGIETALTISTIPPEPYIDYDGFEERATCFRLDMAKLLIEHGAIDYTNHVFNYALEHHKPYILYLVSKNDPDKLQQAIQFIVRRNMQNLVAVDAVVTSDLETLIFAKNTLGVQFANILLGRPTRKIKARDTRRELLIEKLALYFESNRDRTRNTLLTLSAYNNNLELTRYIYETVRDELRGDLNALMKYFIRENVYGKIALSIAFEWCNKDVFIYLYDMLKEFSPAVIEHIIVTKLMTVEGCPDLNTLKANFIDPYLR